MEAETIFGVCLLASAPFIGLSLGWLSIIHPKLRAERNIQRLLENEPGREELAELILRNPNSENIRKAREMVIGILQDMSPGDRRQISSALNQDSIRGRAWYVAKLVTAGRSKHFGRIPTDEWASV